MKITVNGKNKEIDNQKPLRENLEALGYQTDFVAIAVNMTCVPRKDLDQYQLKENDDVEILTPQAGG